MEAVKEQGLAKNIGISNVAGTLLMDIMRSVRKSRLLFLATPIELTLPSLFVVSQIRQGAPCGPPDRAPPVPHPGVSPLAPILPPHRVACGRN